MWKLKPNLKIRPVILWPSLIILLATSVTFYMLQEKEKELRIDTQRRLAESVGEKKKVENELIVTIKAKEIIEEKLQEKEHQIKLVLDKLEKEIIARREAQIQLVIAMQEKRILAARMREVMVTPKNIELEKIVVKTVPELAGKVLVINKERAFIVVDLGRVDKLMLGDILSVYRGSEFIGRVQVEKVEEKVSAAAILPDWKDTEFKENDEVRGI